MENNDFTDREILEKRIESLGIIAKDRCSEIKNLKERIKNNDNKGPWKNVLWKKETNDLKNEIIEMEKVISRSEDEFIQDEKIWREVVQGKDSMLKAQGRILQDQTNEVNDFKNEIIILEKAIFDRKDQINQSEKTWEEVIQEKDKKIKDLECDLRFRDYTIKILKEWWLEKD